MAEGSLVLSSNRGRYAIGDPTYGPDLSAGYGVEIFLGNQWIAAQVQYDPDLIYAMPGPQTLGEAWQAAKNLVGIPGYYAELAGGGIVGLCAGMHVRTL